MALADGVDAPENMVRCMANNYSTLGFWRAWHRSYNLWITRYIYVPLGGTRNRACTVVLVFSFVALWHDLSLRLLAWGWLASGFILPELAARAVDAGARFLTAGIEWDLMVSAATRRAQDLRALTPTAPGGAG